MRFSRLSRFWMGALLSLLLVSSCQSQPNPIVLSDRSAPIVDETLLAGQGMVPLSEPGPWENITGMIGYGDRLWFANSVDVRNHNSADLYSYAPKTGKTRYERHLFSQSVGQPTILNGLLYWPFEDPRFSTQLGEYMVTNGEDWHWSLLAPGEAFHVHAMTAVGDTLFAGTGAWAGRLQRSSDFGKSWEMIYEYPTPPQQVSRITDLVSLNEQLYVGITARQEAGTKLFQWNSNTLEPIESWPTGKLVSGLTPYKSWIYGINTGLDNKNTVWRYPAGEDSSSSPVSEQVSALDRYFIRDLAAGSDALWAISTDETGGYLWRSENGERWSVAYRFEGDRPFELTVYAGNVYVGARTTDEQDNTRGVLWGPAVPAAVERAIEETAPKKALPTQAIALSPSQIEQKLQQLDKALTADATYADGNLRAILSDVLKPIALSEQTIVGNSLSQQLNRALPEKTVSLFGGSVSRPTSDVLQWYLLWAIGLNGRGRVPLALLEEAWDLPSNKPEKYLQPVPAAAWVITQLQQDDTDTITTLVERLSADADPLWLKGDIIGALAALTGEQFGYDEQAWGDWWKTQK